MQAPVPEGVVVEWEKRTAHTGTLQLGTAERHLAEVCTPENFGEWALAFGKKRSTTVWSYLRRGIREAYETASWEQKVDGIFVALECSHTSEIIVPLGGKQTILSENELESIARAVVQFHADKIRKGDRLGNPRRALQILGLVQVTRLLKQQISSVKNASAEKLAVEKNRAVHLSGTELSPVAVVVVRSRECRDVEKYLTESRAGPLTSETLYLASALTYRPEWVVFFETPVALKVRGRKGLIDSVTGHLSDHWVDVRFKAVPDSVAAVPARIPVRFGRRTFEPLTADHAALVLLDLLFSKEENLETSHAKGDRAFAEGRLNPIGKSASSLYRLSTRPQWLINEETAGRLELNATSFRRAHDVRGHFRTREGVAHPVKPHRRRS